MTASLYDDGQQSCDVASHSSGRAFAWPFLCLLETRTIWYRLLYLRHPPTVPYDIQVPSIDPHSRSVFPESDTMILSTHCVSLGFEP